MAIVINDAIITIGNYDITSSVESPITINERLDEVLDSATFNIIVKERSRFQPQYIPFNKMFSKAIEPFTLCHITSRISDKYYFASSECQKIINTTKYLHSVTLYELTKKLETYILGSKAFSHIDNRTDYNTDYDRIRIIVELMNDKYGESISLDSSIQSRFTKEREYSFGPGTTMFDALKEIMANENCIPRLVYDGTNFILYYDDLDLVNENNYQEFDTDLIEAIQSTQSVDEYCSEVETEMSDVLGSQEATSVIVSARGEEDVFTKDTACLLLPSNIDTIKSIEIVGIVYIANNDGVLTLDLASEDEMSDEGMNIFNNSHDGISFSSLLINIEKYAGSTAANYFQTTIQSRSDISKLLFLAAAPTSRRLVVGYKKAVYGSNGDEITETIKYVAHLNATFDITNYLLNQEQYEFLEVLTQPKYIYYEHGSNYIKGFYNVKNNDFWKSLIYGEVKSFMSLVMVTPDNKMGYVSSPYIINKNFRVTYYPMTSIYVRQEKTKNQVTNTTARSYNNGASSVDFKQLIPEIEKNVNSLGLEMKTITTSEDIPIGTYTQYGYIINKALTFSIYHGTLVETIIYNCSPNNKIVAEALSVSTQYEATNLPQTGIITRHIDLSVNLSDVTSNKLFEDEHPLIYLFISDYLIAKPMALISNQEVGIMVCEAIDNYAFDNAKEEGANYYYMNKPVQYSDNDNYQKSYVLTIAAARLEILTTDVLNKLPKVDSLAQICGTPLRKVSLGTKLVYKDPRERLVFNVRVKE